ncbi:hypothetical protein BD309DRAFT_976021 [Dichomitus squalens]|nr:hypothetical protein BD309DRAFT_976021 [Dichomitus squalens]
MILSNLAMMRCDTRHRNCHRTLSRSGSRVVSQMANRQSSHAYPCSSSSMHANPLSSPPLHRSLCTPIP